MTSLLAPSPVQSNNRVQRTERTMVTIDQRFLITIASYKESLKSEEGLSNTRIGV